MTKYQTIPQPSDVLNGWKWVPVEPTEKMTRAAFHIDLSYMPGQEHADRATIYRAMLSAAPVPSSQSAQVTNDGIVKLFKAMTFPVEVEHRGAARIDNKTEVYRCALTEAAFILGYRANSDPPPPSQEAKDAKLNALANNFEITGPDDDGLVWLLLHGNGTTGKAMFNLGSADCLATQVALHLEVDRRAAISASKGVKEGSDG